MRAPWVLRAISTLDFPPPERAAAVSAALIAVIQAGEFVGGQAIQLHGGIGMAEENAVGHYYKRLRAIGKTFGDHSFHLRRYLDLMSNEAFPRKHGEDHDSRHLHRRDEQSQSGGRAATP